MNRLERRRMAAMATRAASVDQGFENFRRQTRRVFDIATMDDHMLSEAWMRRQDWLARGAPALMAMHHDGSAAAEHVSVSATYGSLACKVFVPRDELQAMVAEWTAFITDRTADIAQHEGEHIELRPATRRAILQLLIEHTWLDKPSLLTNALVWMAATTSWGIGRMSEPFNSIHYEISDVTEGQGFQVVISDEPRMNEALNAALRRWGSEPGADPYRFRQ